MKKLWEVVKRYKFFLAFFSVNIALLFILPDTGWRSFEITGDNLLEMLSILPPIFVLLGLLDVWVERETMIKYMGSGSGVKGGVFAFILGAAAAGPLYAAFPVAAVLLKKGAKLMNVFIFIGAWSTAKIPMLLFEASNLGVHYTLLRLACNIVGIILIAVLLEKSLKKEEQQAIYENAEKL
ncbi:MAG: permease [Christensenellales bacterium]|jgi:uncharacterized membrane protein YraQ (UPF0718 family)|nr:permease [Eubacteriales bacterium]